MGLHESGPPRLPIATECKCAQRITTVKPTGNQTVSYHWHALAILNIFSNKLLLFSLAYHLHFAIISSYPSNSSPFPKDALSAQICYPGQQREQREFCIHTSSTNTQWSNYVLHAFSTALICSCQGWVILIEIQPKFAGCLLSISTQFGCHENQLGNSRKDRWLCFTSGQLNQNFSRVKPGH